MIQDLSGKSEDPRVPRPEIEYSGLAEAKKQCGLCGHKAAGKEWRCTESHISIEFGVSAAYCCPFKGGVCPGFSKKPSIPRPPQPKKKGLPVPPGVIFLYFGRPERGSREHQGVVTVAWIEPSPGILHLSFSFCSPKDRWCKATGRDMALARLLHPLIIPFLYSPKRTVHEVTRAVLSHDFERLAPLTPGATMWERVPSWTRGLAKRMSKTRVVAIYRLPGSATRIIANLKEFEIKHLPLSIMSRMMRDIAALGNG